MTTAKFGVADATAAVSPFVLAVLSATHTAPGAVPHPAPCTAPVSSPDAAPHAAPVVAPGTVLSCGADAKSAVDDLAAAVAPFELPHVLTARLADVTLAPLLRPLAVVASLRLPARTRSLTSCSMSSPWRCSECPRSPLPCSHMGGTCCTQDIAALLDASPTPAFLPPLLMRVDSALFSAAPHAPLPVAAALFTGAPGAPMVIDDTLFAGDIATPCAPMFVAGMLFTVDFAAPCASMLVDGALFAAPSAHELIAGALFAAPRARGLINDVLDRAHLPVNGVLFTAPRALLFSTNVLCAAALGALMPETAVLFATAPRALMLIDGALFADAPRAPVSVAVVFFNSVVLARALMFMPGAPMFVDDALCAALPCPVPPARLLAVKFRMRGCVVHWDFYHVFMPSVGPVSVPAWLAVMGVSARLVAEPFPPQLAAFLARPLWPAALIPIDVLYRGHLPVNGVLFTAPRALMFSTNVLFVAVLCALMPENAVLFADGLDMLVDVALANLAVVLVLAAPRSRLGGTCSAGPVSPYTGGQRQAWPGRWTCLAGPWTSRWTMVKCQPLDVAVRLTHV